MIWKKWVSTPLVSRYDIVMCLRVREESGESRLWKMSVWEFRVHWTSLVHICSEWVVHGHFLGMMWTWFMHARQSIWTREGNSYAHICHNGDGNGCLVSFVTKARADFELIMQCTSASISCTYTTIHFWLWLCLCQSSPLPPYVWMWKWMDSLPWTRTSSVQWASTQSILRWNGIKLGQAV